MSTFQKSTSATSPEPSAAMAAELLRERISQENVTQSSVLASRRLDEALLRLERASVGSRITPDQPISASEHAPRSERITPTPAPKKQSTQERFEPAMLKATSTTDDLSPDAIEALFGQPIDVMIVSTKARITENRVLPPAVKPETSCQERVQETEPAKAPAPAPAPAAAESKRDFVCVWQVDEFLVPTTIDQLFLTDSLAEQLAARLVDARSEGLQTIAVTSVAAGEGRSTVAMGLALSIAFSGLRVALVDADRSGVKIASELQLDLDLSWPEAIRRNMPLEEVSVGSQADSLTLVPLLDRDGGAEFEHPELTQMLSRLRQSFDMIVVNCGASAIEDMMLCGTALIVRNAQQTGLDEIETLSHALRSGGVQGIGVIENFCD